MADEMGKPIKQGMGEISKCIRLCEYYLNNSVIVEHNVENKKQKAGIEKAYSSVK